VALINNLPDDFSFVDYESIWSYSASPIHKKDIQVDILAITDNNDYSLIGEVKNKKSEVFCKRGKNILSKSFGSQATGELQS